MRNTNVSFADDIFNNFIVSKQFDNLYILKSQKLTQLYTIDYHAIMGLVWACFH